LIGVPIAGQHGSAEPSSGSLGATQREHVFTPLQEASLASLRDALFVPGHRFGWYARDLVNEVRRFPEMQPGLPTDWRQSQQILEAAVAADAAQRWRRAVGLVLTMLFPIGLGILAYVGYISSTPAADTGSNRGEVVLLIAALEAVLLLVRLIGTRTRRANSRRLRREVAERSEYAGRMRALEEQWLKDCEAWNSSEWRRVRSRPQHVPVGPSRLPRRTDIIGGDLFGWQCLLLTLGSSLLASDVDLDVLDLTEGGGAASLVELCVVTEAVATGLVLLPEHAPETDLFQGLDRSAVTALLVDSLRGPGLDRGESLIDQRILADVTHALRDPVTPARLSSAVSLVHTQTTNPEDRLDDDEVDRLQQLAVSFRGLDSRLATLDATLHSLRAFGLTRKTGPDALAADFGHRLRCVALSGSGGGVMNELLVDLLVERFIRNLKLTLPQGGAYHELMGQEPGARLVAEPAGPTVVPTTPTRPRCVIILEAGRLSERQLETINKLSMSARFELVLLFSSLSSSLAEFVAQHSDVLGFMRLSNRSQAERAVEFIGKNYKMVFSSWAQNDGHTKTLSWGWSESESGMAKLPVGLTQTHGLNDGESTAETSGEQNTYARVHELIVEPEVLQGLGSTALELVPLNAGASRQPVSLDVHPLCALEP
jgi:hypothetical protein